MSYTSKEEIHKFVMSHPGVDEFSKKYLSDLNSDPDISFGEYHDSCVALKVPTEKTKGNSAQHNFPIVLDFAEADDSMVQRMENLYYRELFNRPKKADDPTLENQVIVAKQGDDPLGAAWFAEDPCPAYDGFVYLDMMYVGRGQRGKAIGAKLLAGIYELANPQSKPIITFAWDDSIPFYHKLGFFKTDDPKTEKEDQHFKKMLLPTTHSSFYGHSSGDNNALQRHVIKRGFPKAISAKILDQDNYDHVWAPRENPFLHNLFKRANLPRGL